MHDAHGRNQQGEIKRSNVWVFYRLYTVKFHEMEMILGLIMS